eukprot:4740148-Alexandrium_andersonii.AAC.1
MDAVTTARARRVCNVKQVSNVTARTRTRQAYLDNLSDVSCAFVFFQWAAHGCRKSAPRAQIRTRNLERRSTVCSSDCT